MILKNDLIKHLYRQVRFIKSDTYHNIHPLKFHPVVLNSKNDIVVWLVYSDELLTSQRLAILELVVFEVGNFSRKWHFSLWLFKIEKYIFWWFYFSAIAVNNVMITQKIRSFISSKFICFACRWEVRPI